MRRALTISTLFGMVYMIIEVVYNALGSNSMALVGSTSLWMFLVGGITGALLGTLNEERSPLHVLPYFLQVFCGGCLITLLELVTGITLNIWLDMGIWDYSGSTVNLWGQIDLWHTVCWMFITPTAFWLDDVIRHYLSDKPRPKSWWSYYTDFS